MARNWLWRKASFDGAKFYVDVSELPGGRRLVVHEYPGSERWDVEDMGRKAGKFEITAYFVSETADTDAAALRARLLQPGPGLLSIPMFGSMRVRAMEHRPNWNRQVLNYVGFQIVFVEEGNAFAPAPLGLGAAQLAFMAAGLAETVGGSIDASLGGDIGSSAQVGFIRSDMREQAIIVADDVESFRASTPLPEKIDTEVRLAISDARIDVVDQSVEIGASFSSLLAAVDVIVTERASGGDPASSLEQMVDESLADRTASLGHWGVSSLVSIIPLAAALVYAAQASRILAISDYIERGAAQNARARIAAMAAKVTAVYADLDFATQSAFADLYGLAARHISNRIPDLAPVIIVETGVSLPSNVLAYRLYGDPNRGLELVNRNKVSTPCLMPTQFEAAAR